MTGKREAVTAKPSGATRTQALGWRSMGPAALCVALIAYWYGPTWVAHIRRTLDPFTFNDDARILIWPFFRDAEPTLFVADPFAAYFQAGLPEGYLALYHAFGRLGVVRAASEVVPYLLMLVTLWFVTATGRRLGGRGGAFLSAVLLLGSFSVFDRVGGGLPRAFAFPIVAAAGFALVTDRARLLALLALLGAAFYPVVAALLGLTLFFLLVLPARLRNSGEPATVTKRLGLLGLTFALMVALLVPTMVRLEPYGATISQAMLTAYPEAGPGGRLGPEQQAPFPPWYRSAGFHAKQGLWGTGEPLFGKTVGKLRGDDTRANGWVAVCLGGALVALGARAVRRRSVSPALVRLMLLGLALIVGYVLAAWVTPLLFLPERYAQYGAPLLAIWFLAAGFGCDRDDATKEQSTLWSRLLSWLAIAAVLLVLGGRGTSWVGIEVWVPPEERAVYAEIGKLPADSVVAGWPSGLLENVPYLTQRRVLTNYQLEMPFHRGFTDATRQRLTALFDAYFARDVAAVERLCQQFGVTHLLLEPEKLGPVTPSYYRPFDVQVAERYGSSTQPRKLLELAQTANVSRKVGRFYLLDLSRMNGCAKGASSQ